MKSAKSAKAEMKNFQCETLDLLSHPATVEHMEDGKFELYVADTWIDNDGKEVYSPNIEQMLIPLLLNEVIFINRPWYRKDLSEDDRKVFHKFLVICNDVFVWGCADADEIGMDEIPDLYKMWLKDPVWGGAMWCIQKSNYMPQKPVYDRIQKAGIWNLDEMGLRPNASWSKSK